MIRPDSLLASCPSHKRRESQVEDIENHQLEMVAAPSGSPPAADTIKCTCVSCKGKYEEMRESHYYLLSCLLYKLKRALPETGFKVLNKSDFRNRETKTAPLLVLGHPIKRTIMVVKEVLLDVSLSRFPDACRENSWIQPSQTARIHPCTRALHGWRKYFWKRRVLASSAVKF